METKTRDKFSAHFHPFGIDKGAFTVEKSDQEGRKRRYLEGVTSGLRVDGHGERMTEECIQSFQRQAKSGDILLYEGVHGVNFVNDIGKLVDAWITPDGDWHTSYRLYDELDGIGPVKQEIVNTIWAQLNGLPPYKKPMQKGFSIEGEIPEGGIQVVDESGKRIMAEVVLDGVVLVTRPAYKDSVANAVYKALGVTPPWKVRKGLEKTLRDKIEAGNEAEDYFRQQYQLQDALDAEIRRIMATSDSERQGQLETLFSEYSSLAVEHVLSHPNVFLESDMSGPQEITKAEDRRTVKLRELEAALKKLTGMVKQK